jgi:hypothetical protein
MADNIEALIDALSMMKGMRFIVSTKIQFQQNCAICHAPLKCMGYGVIAMVIAGSNPALCFFGLLRCCPQYLFIHSLHLLGQT